MQESSQNIRKFGLELIKCTGKYLVPLTPNGPTKTNNSIILKTVVDFQLQRHV